MNVYPRFQSPSYGPQSIQHTDLSVAVKLVTGKPT